MYYHTALLTEHKGVWEVHIIDGNRQEVGFAVLHRAEKSWGVPSRKSIDAALGSVGWKLVGRGWDAGAYPVTRITAPVEV